MVVEPVSCVVRRRQHFQTTSPLKLPGRIFSYSHIASTGGGNGYLCFLVRSDKNSGCHGNCGNCGKSGNCHFPLSGWGYLNFVFT